jgi:hypothetical protein
MTKFKEGQQIIILHNPSQPWTEGKNGRVARVETQKFSPLPSLQGILPWYYVLVDEHSGSFSSGCVLAESQIQANVGTMSP